MAELLNVNTTLPYASRKDTIKIFRLIHKREEPKTIDRKSLKINGIGTPTYVILMLKDLGVIDDKGNLLKEAEELRTTAETFKTRLMEMLKNTYKYLFDAVSAPLLSENQEKVKNFFVHHYTDVRKSMLNKYINCFYTLRDIVNSEGNFASLEIKESSPKMISSQHSKEKLTGKKVTKEKIIKENPDIFYGNVKDISLLLNLNINLDIGTSKEAIEELFKNISLAHQTVFRANK